MSPLLGQGVNQRKHNIFLTWIFFFFQGGNNFSFLWMTLPKRKKPLIIPLKKKKKLLPDGKLVCPFRQLFKRSKDSFRVGGGGRKNETLPKRVISFIFDTWKKKWRPPLTSLKSDKYYFVCVFSSSSYPHYISTGPWKRSSDSLFDTSLSFKKERKLTRVVTKQILKISLSKKVGWRRFKKKENVRCNVNKDKGQINNIS